MDKNEFKEQTCEDFQGNVRWKDSKKLVHRGVAYKEIYLKNRKKYPLKFREYQVHHKDKNKKNNRIENLELIPKKEHEKRHNIIREECFSINTYMVFAFITILWFGYLGWASNYKYNHKDVLFMISTLILGVILLYFVNRKKKNVKYI